MNQITKYLMVYLLLIPSVYGIECEELTDKCLGGDEEATHVVTPKKVKVKIITASPIFKTKERVSTKIERIRKVEAIVQQAEPMRIEDEMNTPPPLIKRQVDNINMPLTLVDEKPKHNMFKDFVNQITNKTADLEEITDPSLIRNVTNPVKKPKYKGKTRVDVVEESTKIEYLSKPMPRFEENAPQEIKHTSSKTITTVRKVSGPEPFIRETKQGLVRYEPEEDRVKSLYDKCNGDSGQYLRFGCDAIYYPQKNSMWSRPSKDMINWNHASSYCKGIDLEGHRDWRMPSITEIETLFTYTNDGTAISYPYWLPDQVTVWHDRSQPTYGYAWLFRDGNGNMKPYYKGGSDSHFVRKQVICIRNI